MRPNDTRGALYRPHVAGKTPCISFITVGELLFGAARNVFGERRRADLNQGIRRATIVPYDLELCRVYGELRAQLEKAGRVVAPNDLWIAASALRHSLPLISNNRRHFQDIPGVVLISEQYP
jgi:tRNA(fMet)-specific endonuclease VapC